MACNLYEANDISALYSIVYGEINDRIEDSKLPPFSMKDLEKLIKEIYNEMKDENPTNAELYAQAVPTIFNMVTNEEEIETYLDSIDFDFNPLNKLKVRFNDLAKVREFVSPNFSQQGKIRD